MFNLTNFFLLSAKAQESLPTKIEDVKPIIEKIVVWMINVFWVVVIGFVVWAAFLFLSAGDNTEKIEKAKKLLLYAVIAAIVVLLANGIDIIVSNLLRGQI